MPQPIETFETQFAKAVASKFYSRGINSKLSFPRRRVSMVCLSSRDRLYWGLFRSCCTSRIKRNTTGLD